MNNVDEIFKYKSKMFKMGNMVLIIGIISFAIFYLFKDLFNQSAIFFGTGIGGLIGAVLCYFCYGMYFLVFKEKMSKYKKKYDLNEIKTELLQPDTVQIDELLLTRNYIVSQNNGNIFICKYSELKWVYDQMINAYEKISRIVGYTVDSRSLQYINFRINNDNLNKIFECFKSHNPNVIIGFTKENKELYKNS